MDIIWDRKKNQWLMLNREISFEEIADKILNDEIMIYWKILQEKTSNISSWPLIIIHGSFHF
jgi:hypothetical protein